MTELFAAPLTNLASHTFKHPSSHHDYSISINTKVHASTTASITLRAPVFKIRSWL